MIKNHEDEYILIGDSAVVECLPGRDYASRWNVYYLTGLYGSPALGKDLDFVKGSYYAEDRITPAHGCVLASRILLYKIEHDILSENHAHAIPCADCPFADQVSKDRQ